MLIKAYVLRLQEHGDIYLGFIGLTFVMSTLWMDMVIALRRGLRSSRVALRGFVLEPKDV